MFSHIFNEIRGNKKVILNPELISKAENGEQISSRRLLAGCEHDSVSGILCMVNTFVS